MSQSNIKDNSAEKKQVAEKNQITEKNQTVEKEQLNETKTETDNESKLICGKRVAKIGFSNAGAYEYTLLYTIMNQFVNSKGQHLYMRGLGDFIDDLWDNKMDHLEDNHTLVNVNMLTGTPQEKIDSHSLFIDFSHGNIEYFFNGAPRFNKLDDTIIKIVLKDSNKTGCFGYIPIMAENCNYKITINGDHSLALYVKDDENELDTSFALSEFYLLSNLTSDVEGMVFPGLMISYIDIFNHLACVPIDLHENRLAMRFLDESLSYIKIDHDIM